MKFYTLVCHIFYTVTYEKSSTNLLGRIYTKIIIFLNKKVFSHKEREFIENENKKSGTNTTDILFHSLFHIMNQVSCSY